MRRQRIHVFILTIIITVFISGNLLRDKSESLTVRSTTRTEDMLTSSTTTKKYVTKSLRELGRMDDFNKYFLFLNSVPKNGAEVLILLLQKLQGLNNFKHIRLREGNKRHLKTVQQVMVFLYLHVLEILPKYFRRGDIIPMDFFQIF